jgi:hypothetical protein
MAEAIAAPLMPQRGISSQLSRQLSKRLSKVTLRCTFGLPE